MATLEYNYLDDVLNLSKCRRDTTRLRNFFTKYTDGFISACIVALAPATWNISQQG